MAYVQYLHVAEKGNMNGVEESIQDIINRYSKEGGWTLHSFDFSSGLGRAILERVEIDEIPITEVCCVNGECNCQ